MRNGRAIHYTDDELDFIKKAATLPRRQAHAAFCEAFGRTDVSLATFKQMCIRKGWLTGRTGQYRKGNVPPYKGRKMPYNANSARTQFKKGQLGGKAAEDEHPIGTERLSGSGYIERKMHDGLPRKSRWQLVHLMNWTAVNGPVPAGHCLKSLDGNKANTDATNWIAIPRAMLPRLSGTHSTAYDPAPAELKPAIMATARLEHLARETAKRGQR